MSASRMLASRINAANALPLQGESEGVTDSRFHQQYIGARIAASPSSLSAAYISTSRMYIPPQLHRKAACIKIIGAKE